MGEDDPEEATASKDEITELDAGSEEIALSEEDMEKIKKDYGKFTPVDICFYISYFLFVIHIFSFDTGTYHTIGTPLSLITIISFSTYIYLMRNDDESEFLLFNTVPKKKRIFQIILFLMFLPFFADGILAIANIFFTCFESSGWDNYSCQSNIAAILFMVPLLLATISLSFNKKVLKTADVDSEGGIVDDTPEVGFVGTLFQVILGLSAFFLFLTGIYGQTACFNGVCGSFAESLPCYAISFVFLIFMLAIGLNAQGSSQEPLEREKIKATQSVKFKTRMMVLVVVFSLILAPLWLYGDSDYSYDVDYSEDCNDEVVGPDVDLVDADLSDMKLRGCDLSNRDLTGADFSRADLACADFSNSILEGAYFGAGLNYNGYFMEGPDIRGVTFDNADLSNANFQGTGYELPHLSGLDGRWIDCNYTISFKGANLTNADFDTRFHGSRIGGAELVFDNAIMDNANFVVNGYGYDRVSFDNAIVDNANFVVTWWDWNEYVSVSMVNVSFIGTDISMTLPPGSELWQSNMSEANFIDFMALDLASCPLSLPETYSCAKTGDKTMIAGPSMDFSDKGISFWDDEVEGGDFSGSNFSGLYIPNSIFQALRLSDSNMSDSNLSNSNFTYNHKIYNEQYLEYDDCINSSNQTDNCSEYAETALEEWGIDDFSDFKYLWSANLVGVDFTGSNLSYSDFSYSNMTGANLKDADLTGAIWYYTICPDGTNSGKTGSCSAT